VAATMRKLCESIRMALSGRNGMWSQTHSTKLNGWVRTALLTAPLPDTDRLIHTMNEILQLPLTLPINLSGWATKAIALDDSWF
jgi:hypothetical protein